MTSTQEEHYRECLRNGCSPALAEMFALASPPNSSSEREFLMARENGRQFEKEPKVGDLYRKIAKQAGVDVTGKVYEPQLADYPGDPRAWFSGRSEIKQRCEEEGHGCDGIVGVQPRRREHKGVDVADDIVENAVATQIEKNPALREKPLAELRHETKQRLKGRKHVPSPNG